MKHIVWKAYWDYEKEEQYLNQMSAQGMALKGYTWCRYVFEESQPGEYLYRIELLENLASNSKSQAYLRFLEENGVEVVATYFRWVYLRKRASEGGFEIYSDLDSKIKHYQRVQSIWGTLAAVQFVQLPIQFSTMLNDVSSRMFWIHLSFGVFFIIFGTIFLAQAAKIRSKIKKLKQEKVITE